MSRVTVSGGLLLTIVVWLVASAAWAERQTESLAHLQPWFAGSQLGYSDQTLLDVLNEMGFSDAGLMNSGLLRFAVDDRQLLLINHADGNLQLHFAVTGGLWSYQDVNEWNKSRRLSRAYIDNQGDPVLEADLLASGGVSMSRLRGFIDVYVSSSLIAFEYFLLEHDDADEDRSVTADRRGKQTLRGSV